MRGPTTVLGDLKHGAGSRTPIKGWRGLIRTQDQRQRKLVPRVCHDHNRPIRGPLLELCEIIKDAFPSMEELREALPTGDNLFSVLLVPEHLFENLLDRLTCEFP